MKLSNQQQEAYEKIMAWHKTKKKRYVLGGYAGTGKSTLSKIIAENIDTIFCAYTGKAANVLREKGCYNTSTIHAALYVLISDDDEEPEYELNLDSDIKHADLVIVDEYSMLPEEIIKDIEFLAKKVLYLGDPFQLPPVSGECSLQPDYFLEEIHRQALESPIVRYATDVREGRDLVFCDHKEFVFRSRLNVDPDLYEEADQIIVGYNKTRTAWNKRFREKLGFGDMIYPQRGDKLICTRNNHKMQLFNGMIGECKRDSRKAGREQINISFESYKKIEVWDGNFRGIEKPPIGLNKRLDRFDYAYAITAHKAMGSEFDSVLIYNQPIGKDAIEKRRWLYTSLTRGKKKVVLVQP